MGIIEIVALLLGIPAAIVAIIQIRKWIIGICLRRNTDSIKHLYFTGRVKEIEKIKILLKEHKPILIWGLGGIGKTTLADKVSDDYEMIKINVSKRPDNELIDEIKRKRKDALERKVGLIKIVHNLCVQKKELVILDDFICLNIATASQRLNKILEEFKSVKFIITSRTNIDSQYIEKIALEKLLIAESEFLVKKLLIRSDKIKIWNSIQNNPNEKQSFNNLLLLFDGLALDVEILGQYLSSFSISENPTLIPLYNNLKTFGESKCTEVWERDKKYFNQFFLRLGENEQKLFQLTGLFSSEPFSSDFIEYLANNLLGLKNSDYTKAFDVLKRNSIFSVYEELDEKKYYYTHSRLNLYIDHNLKRAIAEMDLPKDFLINVTDLYIELTEHNSEICESNASHLANFPSILYEHGEYYQVIRFAEKVGQFLYSRIQWDAFRKTMEIGVQAAEQPEVVNDTNMNANEVKANFLIKVGRTYRYQNEYKKAIEYFEVVTSIPLNTRLHAEAYGEIIQTHQRAQNFDIIPKLLEKIEALEIEGTEKRLVVANCYVFLGRINFEEKKKENAIKVLEKSKTIVESLENDKLSDDQLTTKTDIILKIGNSYFHDGLESKVHLNKKDIEDYIHKSKKLYDESYALCKKLLTHQKRWFGFIYDQLGQWELKFGTLEQSEIYLKKALYYYELKKMVDSCAYAYDHLGEINMAIVNKELTTKKKQVKNNTKETLVTAEENFRKALDIFREKKKQDGIAYLLHHQGEAIEYLKYYFDENGLPDPLYLYQESMSIFENLELSNWEEHMKWHILRVKIISIEKNKIRNIFKWVDPVHRKSKRLLSQIDPNTEQLDHYKYAENFVD